MKKVFLFVLLIAVASFTSVSIARSHYKQQSMKLEAKARAAQTVDSTDYVPTYSDSIDSASVQSDQSDANDNDFGINIPGSKAISYVALIPIIGTVCGCLLIGVIIFLIFYFRYKNRQAKYRLAEKALESGKPLPDGIITPNEINSVHVNTSYSTTERDKGIQKTFLGLGLFIFLWAITGNFGVGCIGLLVMFSGVGRWIVAYEHRKDNVNNAETISRESEKQTDQQASTDTAHQSKDGEEGSANESVE